MDPVKIEQEITNKKLPLVDVGIACYGQQDPKWWIPLFQDLISGNGTYYYINRIHAASSMLKDHNKIQITEEKNRSHFTDVNRVAVSDGFLASEAEWIFWVDDDTVLPRGALSHLLGLKREFVSGLYFIPAEPYNPVAYIRNHDGTYSAFYDYPPGSLVEVDSIGFGCCLVHKDVFLKIKKEHIVMKRPNGSLITLHKSRVKDRKPYTGLHKHDGFMSKGVYHLPLYELDADDCRAFPFFQLEYVRTEDHKFCEMANDVGYRPWLDTTVVCEHLKLKGFGVEDYYEKGTDSKNVIAKKIAGEVMG